MSLVACKECNATIGSKADICPNCGTRPPHFTWFGMIIAGTIAVSAVGWAFSLTGKPLPAAAPVVASTSGEIAVDAPVKKYFPSLVDATNYLRTHARDPASIQIANVELMQKSGNICITYRARNGFGGMAIEQAAYSVKHQAMLTYADASFREDWAAFCGAKDTRDITADAQVVMALDQAR